MSKGENETAFIDYAILGNRQFNYGISNKLFLATALMANTFLNKLLCCGLAMALQGGFLPLEGKTQEPSPEAQAPSAASLSRLALPAQGALSDEKTSESKIRPASIAISSQAAALKLSPSPAARAQEYKLANGLKVLIMENHEFPAVSTLVWYKVGSRDEEPGATGLSHMVEHLMFQNVGSFKAGEIGSHIARVGGQFNGYTSDDFTTFFETLPSNRLELALKIESERMSKTSFTEEGVAQELASIKAEFEKEASDPVALVSNEVRAMMFMQHPYHNPTLGWKSDIGGLTAEHAREFYKKFFQPANATIVITGDVVPKQALFLLKKYFEPIAAGKAVQHVTVNEPPPQHERRVKIKYNGTKEVLQVAYRAPAMEDQDAPIMLVLERILNGGLSGRLKSKLIESKLCSSALASYEIKREPGLFTITCTAVPSGAGADTENKVLTALDELINQLRSKPISEAELKRAAHQAEFAFHSECDGPYRAGFHLGYFESLDKWQNSYSWAEKLKTVSSQDLQRVSRKYFSPEARVVAWVSGAGQALKSPASMKPVSAAPKALEPAKTITAGDNSSANIKSGPGSNPGSNPGSKAQGSKEQPGADKKQSAKSGSQADKNKSTKTISKSASSASQKKNSAKKEPAEKSVGAKTKKKADADSLNMLDPDYCLKRLALLSPVERVRMAAFKEDEKVENAKPEVKGEKPVTKAEKPEAKAEKPEAKVEKAAAKKSSGIPKVIKEIPSAVGNAVTGNIPGAVGNVGSAIINIPVAIGDIGSAVGSTVGNTATAIGKQIAQLKPGTVAEYPNISHRVLKNGLNLIVFQSKISPIVQIAGSIEAGDAYSPKDKPGLSLLASSLLSQGSATRNRAQLQQVQDDLGIASNKMLSFDSNIETIDFSSRCLSSDLPELLTVIAEQLTQPALDAGSLEKARQESLAQLKSREESALQKTDRVLLQALLDENSPYCPAQASDQASTISKASLPDLQKFFASHVVPGASTIVLAGDINADDVFSLLEQKLGKWSGKSAHTRLHAKLRQQRVLRSSLPLSNSSKAIIAFGQIMPINQTSADWGSLLIADEILAAHPMFSRFEQALSKTPALERAINGGDINLQLEPLSNLSSWRLSLAIEPAAVPLSVKTVKNELKQISKTGISPEELQEMKRYLHGFISVKKRSTLPEISKGLLEAFEHNNSLGGYALELASVRAATQESVNRIIRNVFKPEQSSLVIAGGAQTIKSARGAASVGND